MTMSTRRIDLRIDITGKTGLSGDLSTAVSVFLPERHRMISPPIVVFAVPGGGYSRGYYYIEMPGFTGYSQADYHAQHGFIFVACDHLGVGDSSIPSEQTVTSENIADGNKATVDAVMERLEGGTLVPDFGPVKGAAKIGMGQSMGGFYTTLLQGRHDIFDAVAFLGWSNIHTVVPVPPGHEPTPPPAPPRGTDPRIPPTPAMLSRGRDAWRWAFHWEDVPQAFVDADINHFVRDPGAEVPRPMWRSGTLPPLAGTGRNLLSAGVVAEEASKIVAPVFIGVGERDVVTDPWAEPRAYPRSKDITVYVVPRMAHMHNFASTRTLLWDRLEDWMRTVVAQKRAVASAVRTA